MLYPPYIFHNFLRIGKCRVLPRLFSLGFIAPFPSFFTPTCQAPETKPRPPFTGPMFSHSTRNPASRALRLFSYVIAVDRLSMPSGFHPFFSVARYFPNLLVQFSLMLYAT